MHFFFFLFISDILPIADDAADHCFMRKSAFERLFDTTRMSQHYDMSRAREEMPTRGALFTLRDASDAAEAAEALRVERDGTKYAVCAKICMMPLSLLFLLPLPPATPPLIIVIRVAA